MTSLSSTPASKGLERVARPLLARHAARSRRLRRCVGVRARRIRPAGGQLHDRRAGDLRGVQILMYAAGLARFIGRASEFRSGARNRRHKRGGSRRHLRRLARALRQRRLSQPVRRADGRGARTSNDCSPTRRRRRRRSIDWPRRRAPAARRSRNCVSRRRLTAKGEAAWYRIRVRPLDRHRRKVRRRCGPSATSPTSATATKRFFHDLQHAIDYLDHSPAGFFSGGAGRRDRLHERDARPLARLRHR